MTKCKDCKYFGDPIYHQVKDPDLHICTNTEKSGYNFCRTTADGCAGFRQIDIVQDWLDQQRKYQEKQLAWIITHYDFIVGSIECKNRLTEILHNDANIICSPYVEDPTMIYAVKKFDIKDLVNLEYGIKFGDQDTLMPAT